MAIQFYKYHGAGNDFVILDNRKKEYDFLTEQQVKKICTDSKMTVADLF